MNKIIAMAAVLSAASCSVAKTDPLAFSATGERLTLTLLDGREVHYTAYMGVQYVTNVEDERYQTLNFFVPDGATQQSPILLRTYVGGYMAAEARKPSPADATGRALAEGMCVCIPGSRGANSEVDGHSTGKAPNGLLDLKAAVRYLRYNDKRMPGSAERIITDGTSAGGAMSALLGATANHPDYEALLQKMGAAKAKDHVYASVCYCPITDLEHADMAYEWLYGHQREDVEASNRYAESFADYVNSLQLRYPNTGLLITDETYIDYLKSYLTASATRATSEGVAIPDSLGFVYAMYIPSTPIARPGGPRYVRAKSLRTEVVVDVDLNTYLSYIVSRQPLKGVPAFDNIDSPECSLFGDDSHGASHFTGQGLSAELSKRVYMMNPMNYIADPKATTAKFWYIRHGALDRDTSFPIPVNLATKLMNEGCQVDFALPWNRRHEGDYNLDELFRWIKEIL